MTDHSLQQLQDFLGRADLTAAQKLLWLVLGSRAVEGRLSIRSMRELAEWAKLGESTVRAAILAWKRAGVIVARQSLGRGSYVLEIRGHAPPAQPAKKSQDRQLYLFERGPPLLAATTAVATAVAAIGPAPSGSVPQSPALSAVAADAADVASPLPPIDSLDRKDRDRGNCHATTARPEEDPFKVEELAKRISARVLDVKLELEPCRKVARAALRGQLIRERKKWKPLTVKSVYARIEGIKRYVRRRPEYERGGVFISHFQRLGVLPTYDEKRKPA